MLVNVTLIRLAGMTLIRLPLVLLSWTISLQLTNTKSWMKCPSTAIPTGSFKFILITLVRVSVGAASGLADIL